MTSSNGNIFRVTGPFWGESIPFTEANDAVFSLRSVPEQTVERTIETPTEIWDVIVLIMSLLWTPQPNLIVIQKGNNDNYDRRSLCFTSLQWFDKKK